MVFKKLKTSLKYGTLGGAPFKSKWNTRLLAMKVAFLLFSRVHVGRATVFDTMGLSGLYELYRF